MYERGKEREILAGERELLIILQHSEVETLLQHQAKTKRSNDKTLLECYQDLFVVNQALKGELT
jgi:hypothetical protein